MRVLNGRCETTLNFDLRPQTSQIVSLEAGAMASPANSQVGGLVFLRLKGHPLIRVSRGTFRVFKDFDVYSGWIVFNRYVDIHGLLGYFTVMYFMV